MDPVNDERMLFALLCLAHVVARDVHTGGPEYHQRVHASLVNLGEVAPGWRGELARLEGSERQRVQAELEPPADET